MYGVGQVDRAEPISCAIIHVTGSRNFSILLWYWASMGLGLPENTTRPKGLQSRRSFLFTGRVLEHGASLFGRNASSCRVRNNSLMVTLR